MNNSGKAANTSKPIRILVVDDHPMIREGIRAVLAGEPDMETVADAADGLEALEQYEAFHPDVTLMDLQMPRMDGIAAIIAIRERWPRARIVVLTTYRGDAQALRALKAGASGYLLKSMIRNDMLNAIRDAHAGRRHIAPEVAVDLGLHAGEDDLSPREVEVIKALALGGSNKVIAERLGITEETVKTHMKSVLSKLGATDRAQALVIALRRGIVTVTA